jgi:hypothetical protein
MKKITLAIAALLASTSAFAQTASSEAVCTKLSQLSAQIMKNRQAGTPLSGMMEVTSKSTNAEVNRVTRKILLLAYDEPRFGTESYQQRSINDFSNKIMLACLKGKL